MYEYIIVHKVSTLLGSALCKRACLANAYNLDLDNTRYPALDIDISFWTFSNDSCSLISPFIYTAGLILSLPRLDIMNFDDDAPPDLVEVSGGIQDSEDGVSIKVPITIVTGEIINNAD